jgi:NADH-quinone oxidoreductase subunit C
MTPADANPLVTMLQDAVPGAVLEPAPSVDLQHTFYVGREHVLPLLTVLRERRDLRFTFLAELTAADFWPREPRFEVVYMLVSPLHKLRARVKVRLPADGATLPTVSGIWPAANWLEREVWDLFGIEFERHPDPRRLLMPEDWDGFPLRKDYPVQISLKPNISEPTQVTEQEFRQNIAKDRLARH